MAVATLIHTRHDRPIKAITGLTRQRFVDRWIERLIRKAVDLQTQPGAGGLERLTDGFEGTLEFTVLTRAINVVQHGEQIGEHPTDRHIAGGLAVAIHPLAVVRVLGVHSPQVICEFNNLGIHRGEVGLKDGLTVRPCRTGDPGRIARPRGRGSR